MIVHKHPGQSRSIDWFRDDLHNEHPVCFRSKLNLLAMPKGPRRPCERSRSCATWVRWAPNCALTPYNRGASRKLLRVTEIWWSVLPLEPFWRANHRARTWCDGWVLQRAKSITQITVPNLDNKWTNLFPVAGGAGIDIHIWIPPPYYFAIYLVYGMEWSDFDYYLRFIYIFSLIWIQFQ